MTATLGITQTETPPPSLPPEIIFMILDKAAIDCYHETGTPCENYKTADKSAKRAANTLISIAATSRIVCLRTAMTVLRLEILHHEIQFSGHRARCDGIQKYTPHCRKDSETVPQQKWRLCPACWRSSDLPAGGKATTYRGDTKNTRKYDLKHRAMARFRLAAERVGIVDDMVREYGEGDPQKLARKWAWELRPDLMTTKYGINKAHEVK